MSTEVTSLPALSDNYIHVIHWDGHALVVDPSESEPVLSFLRQNQLKLDAILITHHHADHIGGAKALKKATRCQVIGPKDSRIPMLDHSIQEGEELPCGPVTFKAFDVPGHTSTHIAFYEPSQRWLFSGDCLFTGGCGRLFEGTPEQMYTSLQKLTALPNDTLVYCGHEYTQYNLQFAQSIEPNNPSVQLRLEKVSQLRQQNHPTVPAPMEVEKATNPFLRAHSPSLKKAVGMENATDIEVFAHIRSLKDQF